MAFVKILGPGDAPVTLTDWQKISEIMQATWLRLNAPPVITGAYVKRGSAVCVGGQWYVATTDTAITGTASDYVRLTVSGDTLTAAYASSLSSVSWNHEWSGWYDTTGRYYLFDEIKAFSVGAITKIYSSERWSPELNWTIALNRVLSASSLSRLFRPSSLVTLTGSGTYTVPSGVYAIRVKMIGPGSNGTGGDTVAGGVNGWSGEEKEFYLSVTPGQTISYAVTAASTIFGSTTALKGGWLPPSALYGGGVKPGMLGGAPSGGFNHGSAGTNGYGGGGGAGGKAPPVSPYTTNGGAGGLGRIDID